LILFESGRLYRILSLYSIVLRSNVIIIINKRITRGARDTARGETRPTRPTTHGIPHGYATTTAPRRGDRTHGVSRSVGLGVTRAARGSPASLRTPHPTVKSAVRRLSVRHQTFGAFTRSGPRQTTRGHVDADVAMGRGRGPPLHLQSSSTRPSRTTDAHLGPPCYPVPSITG
jgi:hypothetical protein